MTGAPEALYADLGHFGRGPIRKPPGSPIVLPALTLETNFGQGALVLSEPGERSRARSTTSCRTGRTLPLVLLATRRGTIIASQAVITGAFSLTRQAVQLGLLPRLEIRFSPRRRIPGRSTCRG